MGIVSRFCEQLSRRVAASGLILPLLVGCAGSPPDRVPVVRSDGRYVMGTVLEITIAAPTEAEANAAIEELFRLAAKLERVFTVFEPESPLRRLNRRAGGGPLFVDPEIAHILAESVAYWRLTGGIFDVTVGPLGDLWRLAARRNRPPGETELAASLALVGSDKILVGKGGSVALERPGMSVNLGGIAKGYALDRMEEHLRARGISRAFVSFGQSSILAVGAPPDASGWQVLLRNAGEGFAGVATLRDQSLSVSASFGQWSEIAGRRYGHLIDPRSGEAMTRAAQAAVLAPSGALAEALSKALLILTPQEGLALLEGQPAAEGLLIEGDRSAHATSGWARTVAFEGFLPEGVDRPK
jgi:thiamine biosynthesis lipoprotein